MQAVTHRGVETSIQRREIDGVTTFYSVALPFRRGIEIGLLFLMVCAVWGVILYMAMATALQ